MLFPKAQKISNLNSIIVAIIISSSIFQILVVLPTNLFLFPQFKLEISLNFLLNSINLLVNSDVSKHGMLTISDEYVKMPFTCHFADYQHSFWELLN